MTHDTDAFDLVAAYRRALAVPELARRLLAAFLPAAVREALDMMTLTSLPDHFIRPEAQGRLSDRLYRVVAADGYFAYIYVLVAHPGGTHSALPLDVLTNMLAIWDGVARDARGWRPIVPLVVYLGEPPWMEPTEFGTYFHTPAGALFEPDFRFYVIDRGRQLARLEAVIESADLFRHPPATNVPPAPPRS